MIARLEDILITDELTRRPARRPDYEAENRALAALAEAMAGSPQTILQTLAETAMELCRAGSAGICILEPGSGGGTFRSHGMAGAFAHRVVRGIPRTGNACGLVLDENTSVLLAHPERHFKHAATVDPPIVEALMVPFRIAGEPAGTLFVVAHTPSRQFDCEDERLLTRLSRFAAAAHQMKIAAEVAVDAKEEVRQILDTAATAIVRCSRDLRFISANPAYAKLMGFPSEQIIGRPIVDVIGPVTFELIRPYVERVLRGERVAFEAVVPTPSGLSRNREVTYTPWLERDGTVGGWVASISDITELKSTAEALRKGQQDLRLALNELSAILQTAPIAIVTMDRQGKVITWDDAAVRILGYAATETIGRPDPSIPSDGYAQFSVCLATALAGTTVRTRTWRIQKDGSVIQVWRTLAPFRDEHGKVKGAIALVEDITEKTNTEVALARAKSALAEVQAEEARRIAGELHDDITQRLALISFEIEKILSGPSCSYGELWSHLCTVREEVNNVSDGVRDISHRMHPSVVEYLGLTRALEYLCGDFSEREGIPIRFHPEGAAPEMPPVIAYSLYRIAQEALHNISKYAKAGDVDLTLARTGQTIEFSITDSGVGFDTSARNSGLGLHSMRERVELLDGTFVITSAPGRGTQIVASIPLPPKNLQIGLAQKRNL
jgi:PAS domain S-box-containing protein